MLNTSTTSLPQIFDIHFPLNINERSTLISDTFSTCTFLYKANCHLSHKLTLNGLPAKLYQDRKACLHDVSGYETSIFHM